MSTTTNPTTEKALDLNEVEAVSRALSAPFDPGEVRFKPGAVSGNRALALAYVDARVIQDRLDEVLGVMGWQDDYKFLEDGSVVCRLRLRIGGEWITKVDVGGPSEQPDEGDRRKAAVSDALKRAAVKFGVGRYLYRLPGQWVDYDSHKRQFVRPPSLPPSVLPVRPKEAPVAKPAVVRSAPRKAAPALPANGVEFQRRLYDYDSKLAAQGLCAAGELVKHIVQAGVSAGHEADLSSWNPDAMVLAVEETKTFEAKARQRMGDKKEVA